MRCDAIRCDVMMSKSSFSKIGREAVASGDQRFVRSIRRRTGGSSSAAR
jgi:hypothetical protein